MTDNVDLNAQASLTNAEKQGLANDLNYLATMIAEHGQYIFNLVAAVNVQQDILLSKNLTTEAELQGLIEAELKRMKEDFIASQKKQAEAAPANDVKSEPKPD